VTVTTPLSAPTKVAATVVNSGKISLTWTDNDSRAAGYDVLRSTDGIHYSQIASLASKTADSATDSTVTSGQSYDYEVQAYATANTSPVSSPATVVTPLAAPSGLAASAQSSNWIHLSWTDNSSSATGYLLLRSTDGIHYSQLSRITTAGANSFDDKSVLPLTTYYYQVEAVTSAVTSAASTSANATTPLAIPSAVTGIAVGATSVTLNWTDNDPAAQGYKVFRSTNGASFTQIEAITSSTITTWNDTSVSSNHTYAYEVQAVHGSSVSNASSSVTVVTPLIAPTALSASIISGNSVHITWTDNDPSATSYAVSRSTDGIHYTLLTTIASGAATSYTDSTDLSGHSYSYEVKALAGNNSSAPSTPATVTVPLVAPTSLSAVATSANSVLLNWQPNDPSATGYSVLRSTNGSGYVAITAIQSASASSYIDTTVTADHTYSYKVQAYNTLTTSAPTASVSATTLMLAPAQLVATVSGSSIVLTWTDVDSTATGYTILRSTNGTSFTQLTTLNTANAHTYIDSTATAGQTYYYQVQATNGSLSSAVSNTVNATIPSIVTQTVTITTRYSDELVITAAGTDDTVALSETSNTLTIIADGQTSTDAVPAAGVFVYTRGGTDQISVGQSVTAPTTLETIDGAIDHITSAGTDVTAWIDSNDIYTGTGTVHKVSSFAGGVSKATGASLPDPSDSGPTTKLVESLWGTGPVAGDVNQGGLGDCYFLSTLAAFANTNPAVLQQSAVDMGDGTFTVEFYSHATPTFVRVSNDISTGEYWGYEYARPGADNTMWAPVMEKAYAYFRTGANTYASLSSGWMGDVYAAFNVSSEDFMPSAYSAGALYTMLSTDLADGEAVTLGTDNAPNLVSGHAYTLISASDVNGTIEYVVRNPWGISGDSLEDSNGYATLTYAQLVANFVDGCQAT
jgi:fibronectin type 3 domain-containing protein